MLLVGLHILAECIFTMSVVINVLAGDDVAWTEGGRYS